MTDTKTPCLQTEKNYNFTITSVSESDAENEECSTHNFECEDLNLKVSQTVYLLAPSRKTKFRLKDVLSKLDSLQNSLDDLNRQVNVHEKVLDNKSEDSDLVARVQEKILRVQKIRQTKASCADNNNCYLF
ncbi:hypothetical protein SteCoe_13781 [Stentor coeruleus]|uniref:Uncharacterized protein n=1 Tax=Stentor coeruleus TaxID=5963 RepID=A0A1R2C7K9_9CILI|nr:hypothetical protein SteCoe_13781 [Stentor coeruleus]